MRGGGAFPPTYRWCLNLWRLGGEIAIPKCPCAKLLLRPGTPGPTLGEGRELGGGSPSPHVNLLARVLSRGAGQPAREIGGVPVGGIPPFPRICPFPARVWRGLMKLWINSAENCDRPRKSAKNCETMRREIWQHEATKTAETARRKFGKRE